MVIGLGMAQAYVAGPSYTSTLADLQLSPVTPPSGHGQFSDTMVMGLFTKAYRCNDADCLWTVGFSMLPGPTALLTGMPVVWSLGVGGAHLTITSITINGRELATDPYVFGDLNIVALDFTANSPPRLVTFVFKLGLEYSVTHLGATLLIPAIYLNVGAQLPADNFSFIMQLLSFVLGVGLILGVGGIYYWCIPQLKRIDD